MADDINSLRGEVKDVSTGLTDVKVAIGGIRATTEETHRRIGQIEHAVKNLQSIGQTVALLGRDMMALNTKVSDLEKEKADKVETDYEMKQIKERLTAMEDAKKKFGERISKWTTPFILSILMAVGGYIAMKLGFTDFLNGGRP